MPCRHALTFQDLACADIVVAANTGEFDLGKHSNFERNPRDFYATPYEAVLPILPFVRGSFIEPCAGDGRLIRHLTRHGLTCVYACDIEPQDDGIEKQDILFFGARLPPCDLIITNPPWKREVLHRMIELFRDHAPSWILLDSDWMFTKQAKPYLKFCHTIISVGRVCWMGNGVAGLENVCWYAFDKTEAPTVFIP